MKMKTPIMRSIVIISIIVLSVLIGIIYDAVWDRIDHKNYPRDHSEYVEIYADKYGVPEYVVYGVIKYESGFDSGFKAEDGGAGLMGITESEFNYLLRLNMESLDSDSRYGPETGIKYGCFMLADLHAKLGSWEAVFAAKTVPMETWQGWVLDPSNYNEDGIFETVPDEDAVKEAQKITAYVQKYRDLYYD